MKPHIVDETGDFSIVYKPPKIHCAPLGQKSGDTLLDWYLALFPKVSALSGRKNGEGGLVHRLDFETQGLVLFAKNQPALDFFLALQDKGNFIKEYSALSEKIPVSAPGFPPLPDLPARPPFTVESFFRPFGPGRKQVRPVITETRGGQTAKDKGGSYRTCILGISEIVSTVSVQQKNIFFINVKISRGFRHQIRCHLAWLGFPILNDPLYGRLEPREGAFLGLRASALLFPDPGGGQREYRIPRLETAGFSG